MALKLEAAVQPEYKIPDLSVPHAESIGEDAGDAGVHRFVVAPVAVPVARRRGNIAQEEGDVISVGEYLEQKERMGKQLQKPPSDIQGANQTEPGLLWT